MIPEECFEETAVNYTTEEIEDLKFEDGVRIIVTVVIPIMAVFGILFNLTFVFVVLRSKQMHTVTNAFLVQLAICDFATLVFDTVKYLWIYVGSSGYNIQQGSVAGCTIYNFLFYFTYFVGVNFIFLVAIERYFAICKPFLYRMFDGKSRARKTSAICWILGGLFSITALVPQKLVTICASLPNDNNVSEIDNSTWLVFHNSCEPACVGCFNALYIFDTLQFVVVLVVNSVLYIAIVRELKQRDPARVGINTADEASKLSRSVARMLIINGLAFFVLLGPYQIWNVVLLIKDYTGVLVISEEALYWLEWVSRLCPPINFSINSLIYGGSNKYYRQAFMKVFRFSVFKRERDTTE